MLQHTLQCTGPLINKDLSGPNVNPAKVEKACLPGSSPGGSREFEGGDGVGVFGKIHI